MKLTTSCFAKCLFFFFFLDKCAYGVTEPSPVSVLFLTLEIWCHYLENYVEKILSVPECLIFQRTVV